MYIQHTYTYKIHVSCIISGYSVKLTVAGLEDLMVLQTVLSSYWDRYCALMLMDSSITGMDSKGMLQQWIEGLQV